MYRKRKRISHFGQRLLLVLITLAILLLLALAGCAYWGWRVTSSETSFPNMSLDGIPVGGLTREELALRLTEQRWPGLEDSTLTVLFPLDLSCTLDRSQAGATRSAEATADALCRFGHDGDWFENLGTYLRAWLHPGSFAVALQPPELNKTYITANIRSVTDRFQELTADRDTTLDREHACLSLVKGGGSVSRVETQTAALTPLFDYPTGYLCAGDETSPLLLMQSDGIYRLDENGGIHGGAAGDQTGKEWQLRSWYNRPWSCVLRHPDEKVREKIAELATKAAKNDKIGYDQYQRDTYWQQLQKVGYDPSKITTACEADCSAGVIANVKAVGYLLGLSKLKNLNASYTGNMRSGFKAAGFTVLTASKYLTSPDYLLPGDILLNDSHHTATNITKGSKADGGSESAPAVNPICGTCTITLNQFLVGAQHNQVKAIQRILNDLGYKGKNGKKLDVDGDLGENTSYAIASFQKAKGLNASNPGTVAAKTWNLLLNA